MDIDDFLEESERLNKRLLEEFCLIEPVEILGIVGDDLPATVWTKGSEYKTLVLNLPKWKMKHEKEFSIEGLRLEKYIDIDHDRNAYDNINKFTAYVLNVRILTKDKLRAIYRELSIQYPGTSSIGLLEKVIKEYSDKEIKSIIKELQKPVIINDKKFGELTLNRSIDIFISEAAEWGEHIISLMLESDNSSKANKSIKIAKKIEKVSNRIEENHINNMSDKYCDLYNDKWREGDEKEITIDKFKSKINLDTVVVNLDKSYEFYYDLGEFFVGHQIKVDGSLGSDKFSVDLVG